MKTFSNIPGINRRKFLQASTLAVAGAVTRPSIAQAGISPGETLRIGLVGCGGRGTGAAAQALAADPNVKLAALGDAFGDRLQGSLDTLKNQRAIAAKIDVPQTRRFVGLDAYQKVIE